MTNTTLYGTDSADFISDTTDSQDIDAQAGNDFIVAANEQHYEIINGGAGSDTISYANLYGVHVDLGNVSQGYGWTAETADMLASIENVVGSSYADSLLGSEGNNELFGFSGNDFFEGRGGADKLSGGDGFDTASYAHATSGITANLFSGWGYGGEAQSDQFFSIEGLIGSSHDDSLVGNGVHNVLEGGAGADYLAGNDGNDDLSGGSGSDLLFGGQGGDNLTGGSGSDTFVFTATSESTKQAGHLDTITDFNHSAVDRIDLSEIDARVHTSGDQHFSYIGANAFTHEGQVSAHTVDGGMMVEVNTDGSSGAEMSFLVSDILTLTSADFIF